jgi:hypothetical protein
MLTKTKKMVSQFDNVNVKAITNLDNFFFNQLTIIIQI